MILDEIKEEYVKDLLEEEKRMDGRGLLDYRKIKIEREIIQNAEGSTLVHLGDTKVLAGIKIEVAEPFKDKPYEGVFSVSAEFLPSASPEFVAGPPNENSIELARIVDRGIRSGKVMDMQKLVLEDGKVYSVFIDLYILDHAGNLIDASSLAAMSALLNCKLPKYENKQLIREEFIGNLSASSKVVTCTFEKIDGKILLDANDEEEVASEGRLTLATSDEKHICASQKSGRTAFTKEKMLELVDVALKKGNELRNLL